MQFKSLLQRIPWRLIVGFIIAPISPALLFSLAVLSRGGDPNFLLYLQFAVVAGYPAAFLFGVPLYFLMRRFGMTTFIHYAIAGAWLGTIPWLAVFGLPLLSVLEHPEWFNEEARKALRINLATAMLCGAVAATVFWGIVHRPPK